jgi:hypothetical protein
MLRFFNYLVVFIFFVMFIFYQVGFVVNEELFVFLAFFCFLEFFGKTITSAISGTLDQRAEKIYLDLITSQENLFKTSLTTIFYYSKIIEIRKFTKELVVPIYIEFGSLYLTYTLDFYYMQIFKNFYNYVSFLNAKASLSRTLIIAAFLANFNRFLAQLFTTYHESNVRLLPSISLFQATSDFEQANSL